VLLLRVVRFLACWMFRYVDMLFKTRACSGLGGVGQGRGSICSGFLLLVVLVLAQFAAPSAEPLLDWLFTQFAFVNRAASVDAFATLDIGSVYFDIDSVPKVPKAPEKHAPESLRIPIINTTPGYDSGFHFVLRHLINQHPDVLKAAQTILCPDLVATPKTPTPITPPLNTPTNEQRCAACICFVCFLIILVILDVVATLDDE
jgi:hypothetical protein